MTLAESPFEDITSTIRVLIMDNEHNLQQLANEVSFDSEQLGIKVKKNINYSHSQEKVNATV